MDMRKLTKLVIIRRHTAREWKHQSLASSTGREREMKLKLISLKCGFFFWTQLNAVQLVAFFCGRNSFLILVYSQKNIIETLLLELNLVASWTWTEGAKSDYSVWVGLNHRESWFRSAKNWSLYTAKQITQLIWNFPSQIFNSSMSTTVHDFIRIESDLKGKRD